MADDAAERAAMLDETWVILKDASGGSSDSDTKDVAVNPTGPLGDDSVITTTAPGWRRNAARYCSDVTAGEDSTAASACRAGVSPSVAEEWAAT
jgi:hypothetical protein